MANPVMAYAWGSHDGIAALQGRAASDQPEAELWMGAHPRAASVLADPKRAGGAGEPLDAWIVADPEAVVGRDIVARFGPRLPFMLKVLSAAQPLSLQVHPDDALAREGCAAEDAAGIDRAAPERSYRDPYAKPELLVAVTDFEVLLGFRPAAAAADALAALGVRRLDRVVEALRGGAPTGEGFLAVVSWPAGQRADLVAEVRAAAAGVDDERSAWVVSLADRYPTDPGVVGVVLLNYLRLRPGQAVYVDPGQIHAYLCGTGLEVLGSSDNVVRGGLTPKHVAIAELRRALAVEATSPQVIEPFADADGVERWNTSRSEFALARLRVDGERRDASPGPAIVLCLEGKVEVNAADATVMLNGGESAFVTANAPAVTFVGEGVLIRATAGPPPTKARSGA